MRSSGLSIDVDSVASHLEGYGFPRPPDDGQALRIAVPRFLALLESLDARATFFLIVEEAAAHPDVVREIVGQGHEVACHSMTHPVPFTALADDALEVETTDARHRLEDLTGTAVTGFRAPSFGIDARVLAALVRGGFRYDASSYPSPALPLMRRAIRARASAAGPGRSTDGGWGEMLRPTRIHRRATDAGPLVEVPVTTLPGVRLPYYHTPAFLLPSSINDALGRWARTRRRNVSYTFHAVDFLEVEGDDLDPRIGRHPGMTLPLDRKLALAETAVRALARRGPILPLQELITRELDP